MEKLSSKDMFYMLTSEQRRTLPLLRIHYMDEKKCSIWEDVGLIKCREIKGTAKKVFSIRYNRKELLKHFKEGINL